MSGERTSSASETTALRHAWRSLWTSRLMVLAAGVLGVLEFGTAPGTTGFDPTRLTAPFGYFGNLLAAPSARWDSAWYLAIAHSGYHPDRLRTAFFPLYPLLIKGLSYVVGSLVVAGVVISLAGFLAALFLLERLSALDLDLDTSRLSVTLLAFCPVAYFFSAVYSESLFLALSLGAVYAARRERWALAGGLGGLAAATRNSGVVLLVPLLMLYLWGPRGRQVAAPAFQRLRRPSLRALRPRHRVRPSILWLALVPGGLGAYLVFLAIDLGDGLAPFHVQHFWYHAYAGPFGGVWEGAVAAWDGLRQLLHGPPPPVYFTKSGGDPLSGAGANLMLFGFLVLGAVTLAGTLRWLPLAYGAYVVAALALPLTYPVTPQPLQSLPRYEVVLFPLFMAGAAWAARRGSATRVVACSAVLLGLFTAQFATWRFVA
jgi:hypothetical protein